MHLHIKSSALSCCRIETSRKNMHWINNISLHRSYQWQTVFPFLMTVFTNGKKIVGTGIFYYNMFNKYRVTICTSKFLALKVDALYLFKKSEKSIQVWRNLKRSSKTKQAADTKSQNHYINTKQSNFHINSIFTNLFIWFNKLSSSTGFSSLDAST